MKTVSDHLKQFPKARPSTLVHLETRNRKTEQLRTEVEADRLAKLSPLGRVLHFAGKLKRLATTGRV